jgi:hypothetical protein
MLCDRLAASGSIELHWLENTASSASASSDGSLPTTTTTTSSQQKQLRSFYGNFSKTFHMRAAEVMLTHLVDSDKLEIMCEWREDSQSYESKCTIL